MNLFLNKGKINPQKQALCTILLASIPAIGFFIFTLIANISELAWGPIGHWNERFTMYGWTAFLSLIPFIQIGKTIKAVPYVFALWILSAMLIFFSGFSGMIVGLSLTLMVPLTIVMSYSIMKWSRQWNEQFTQTQS